MKNYKPAGPGPKVMPMLTPKVSAPKTASGGDRIDSLVDAKWMGGKEPPAPFMYNKQADTVAEVACAVCDAPLRVYEVKEHTAACEAIAASDGKDKELPEIQELQALEQEDEDE